jgi:hypothetical protein
VDYRRLYKARLRLEAPEDFLVMAVEYFTWCEANPLAEEQIFHHKGEITRTHLHKVRAFSKSGLCRHMGVGQNKLDQLRERKEPEWQEVVDFVETVIWTQKFENAAAGLLHAGLIGRDLGLADRQEVTGRDGGPFRTSDESTASRKLEAYLDRIAQNSTDEVAG